ncbi:hypothetical protein Dimus_001768 [Dionaea muscipula]
MLSLAVGLRPWRLIQIAEALHPQDQLYHQRSYFQASAALSLGLIQGVHFNLGFASVERTRLESPGTFPPCRNNRLSGRTGSLEERNIHQRFCGSRYYPVHVKCKVSDNSPRL